MKKNLLIQFLMFFALVSRSIAISGAECLQKGYKNCLDGYGSCTMSQYRCSTSCSSDSSCSSGCCYSGYCATVSTCGYSPTVDTGVSVLAIILPVFFGVLFLVLIIVLCVRWRIRKQNQITLMNQQQNALHMNNQMRIQNQQMQNYGGQNPFGTQAYIQGQQQQQMQGMNLNYYGNMQPQFTQQPRQNFLVGVPVGQDLQPTNGAEFSKQNQPNISYI